MVDNDENILVEFDYQNVVLVDPNKVVDSQGVVKERLLHHENLVYYANLEAIALPRTRFAVGVNGNYEAETVSIAQLNFMQPGGKTFLTDEYLDEITGLNTINGKGVNQIIEQKNSITKNDKTTESYISQTVKNNVDTQLLGITQISINSNLSFLPDVTIEMEDIRGRALFEKGENSPYAVFFNYPYPLFYLTVKGYLGKAVKYQLSLQTFNARFDTTSGNFKITVKFLAYKYNVLSNVLVKYLYSLPFMYETKYQVTNTNTPSSQSAQNTVGNTNGSVVEYNVSKGRQKIKEVYSEYKSKGLIDENFPEITIQDLVARLANLEKDISNTFTQADMTPITDGDNYRGWLNEYEKDVFYNTGGDSWFSKYLDDKNFIIQKNTGIKFYTFKKEIIDGGDRDVAKSKLNSILAEYNDKLNNNKTFGKNGSYNIQGKSNTSSIDIEIKEKDFIQNITFNDIDVKETFYLRYGKTPTPDEITNFTTTSSTYFNSTIINNNTEAVYTWYFFEGESSFIEKIDSTQNILNSKLTEIETVLSEILSSRLEDSKYLGFKPLLKNVIAVILASTEGFLRLMCDVHELGWAQREEKYRQTAILGDDKKLSVDSKESVNKSGGNLVPIYPWPQFFNETNDEKGEKYELAYPGDPKYISKTKAFRYDIWPEVQFVEEFIKGRVKTQNYTGSTSDASTNAAQVINKISLTALDFPTSNSIFSNKAEVKFFNEIWERVFLYSNYQRFMRTDTENLLSDLIAESEFINIKNALSNDSPYLIFKLKKYDFNSVNFEPFLARISNGGVGESWQKHIRDVFVTNYIQQEVDNSFTVIDNIVVTPNYNIVNPRPKQLNNLEDYLTTSKSNATDITDTIPFTGITDWFRTNLADGKTSSPTDIYNTTKSLLVNEDKKMIANFAPQTSVKETRPITNFNFYNITKPEPSQTLLKSFYLDRTTEVGLTNQLPTEGSVYYKNYSGNVSSVQTTSLLNTPYFVNAIQEGVENSINNVKHPYVSSAFLFLNSLPLATLREKYKTYDGVSSLDMDYIFATFKKFGAIHKVPYAWVLKYGSIWHRYKTWIETGNDILKNVTKNFDINKNFDPNTSNPNKVYNLTINGVNQNVYTQKTNTNGIYSTVEMNTGFYPKVIDDFNLFFRGYNLFTGFTDAGIQDKLNTDDGFTLMYNDTPSINKNFGYNKSLPNESLRFRAWSCVLNDKKLKKQFIVPSFGSTINQAFAECFDNNDKLLFNVKSNPAVFNGSVRTFWSLPNYGYFDITKVDIPTPAYYMKSVFFGESQQESFSLGSLESYTSIEEVFSIFNREVMDIMEDEFLKFSNSMYDYEIQMAGQNTATRVLINTLPVDNNNVYKNFQILMGELLLFNTVSDTESTQFTNNVQNNQLTNFVSVIQKFLEFDVVLKYANPSNFNRRLFDSYSTVNFIEDKITFNPYIANSLPSSSNTTYPLSAYTNSNPQVWSDLQTYVGFSTEPGIKYTSTGSTITDFFIDMNIEFTSDSVKTLAPLIKIYATQKKLDPTFNKGKFTTALNNYLTNNKKFTNLVFDSLFLKIKKGLPDIQEITDNTTDKALQGEQTPLELWETFKALNDSWIAGYDYTQTTFMEDVLLLDRANRNIGDQVYIDPYKVRVLLDSMSQSSSSVYSYVESLLDVHHFICMQHPAYINYYNVQEVEKNNVPKSEGTLEFGNNLFGTFLSVDTRNASPKLVCTYAAEPSSNLAMDKNENVRFKNDSFELNRASDMPLLDKLDGKTDWGLSNKVVGFNVDIGIRNQNIFYHFDVSQDLGKQTSESLSQMDNMINQSNGRTSATQNVSLWNFYKKRSYQSKVQCLGNVMIQPTMYFNLRYVPMFYGPYYIMEVKHNITPGKFETTFTGIRQQIFALPKLNNYMQTLTKTLISQLKETLKQQINTNPTGQNQNSNSSNPTNPREVTNAGSCVGKLYSGFTSYSQLDTQTITTINVADLANGLKTNITGTANDEMARLISFVTIYLDSYKGGNVFTSWNYNYCGLKLNYAWSRSLKVYLESKYLCQNASDGFSYPYAVFKDINYMFAFLKATWKDHSGGINRNAETMLQYWFTKWNVKVTTEEYNNWVNINRDLYNQYIDAIRDALTLAQNNGL